MPETAHRLSLAFARYGVALSDAEITSVAGSTPREAILLLLATREIAARFDAAHGRVPNEADIDLLAEMVAALP